eukprot:scaffold53_cov193-Pinguiococcus_pyrenoidosus.AAC.27
MADLFAGMNLKAKAPAAPAAEEPAKTSTEEDSNGSAFSFLRTEETAPPPAEAPEVLKRSRVTLGKLGSLIAKLWRDRSRRMCPVASVFCRNPVGLRQKRRNRSRARTDPWRSWSKPWQQPVW